MPRLILLAALLLAACDAGRDLTRFSLDGLSQDSAALVGTWDLISVTSPGMAGPPSTEPVEPDTETYAFRPDGTLRIESVWRDEPEETMWAVETHTHEDAEGEVREAPTLRIGGSRTDWFGIDGDRLYFDARPRDGSLREYARR